MGRTAAVYVFPALLIALGWLRLEETRADGIDWLWVVLSSRSRRPWRRSSGCGSRSSPRPRSSPPGSRSTRPRSTTGPGSSRPSSIASPNGVGGFYDVTVPFNALEHQRMHGVVLLAIFGFCVVLAQLIAARRPLPALLVVIAGAGWPAALYPVAQHRLRRRHPGCRALGPRRPALDAGRVPALVAGACDRRSPPQAAASSAAVAKDGVLSWEQLEPGGPGQPVSVSYVWEGTYGGIEFPKKKTNGAPDHRAEARASTGARRRSTSSTPTAGSRTRRRSRPGRRAAGSPTTRFCPPARSTGRTWIRQDVEVVALKRRPHHRGRAAGRPSTHRASAASSTSRTASRASTSGLKRGQRYTVYSYAPRPGPAELARLEAEYPPALDRFLDIGRTRVDPFGVPGRDRLVDGLFADDRYLALWPYEAMWEEARGCEPTRERRMAPSSRSRPGCARPVASPTTRSPPATGGAPPLAHFVAEGKRGYCQHFAGAMALMLRMLGIPARVAVGFTSGTHEDGGWTVTDHNAHAWVEVWFPGYGWLPFDPTPERGSLAANYSASSTGFNAGDAADGFVGGATRVNGGGADQLRLLEQKERLAEQAQAGRRAGDNGSGAPCGCSSCSRLAAVAALGLAKLVRRRSRYLTRDPRRLAGAARRELVDFLADQGIAVSASTTPEELHELLQAELGADGRPFARALAEARGSARRRAAPPPRASARRRAPEASCALLRHRLGRTARLRGLLALRSLRT